MNHTWARMRRRIGLLVAMVAVVGPAACGGGDEAEVKIGFLGDFSGPLTEYGAAIQTGVDLAIKHINEAGGVNGSDVVLAVGDTRVDPTQAIAEARRLVDDGVHAFVGPFVSTQLLAVVDSVSRPDGIPTISPSATAPAVTDADDDGYLFRTTGSDAVQGVVLARLVEREGHSNVGVILFRDDTWGQGLSEVFAANFSGTTTLASYAADGQASYLAELQQAAANGAEVLVAMGFSETAVFILESIEHDIFTRFIFTDGNRSEDLIGLIGAGNLEGAVGTAPGSDPENTSTKAWNAAYVASTARCRRSRSCARPTTP